MSLPKRALPILSATALALGLIVAPAAVSSAVTPATVAVTVQLTTLKGAALKTIDADETISIQSSSSTYYSYARSAAFTGNTGEYAGKIKAGKVVFPDVPVSDTYAIQANGSRSYSYVYKSVAVGSKAVTAKLALTKYASISGKLVGPGGKAVKGAQVDAISSTGFSAATTSASGKCTLNGLGTGTYRIQFNAHSSGITTDSTKYTWSYWKKATTASKATKVKVSAETAKKAATSKTGINGTVKAAHTQTINVYVPGSTTAGNGYSLAVTASVYYEDLYSYQPDAAANPKYVIALNKGSYGLAITVYTSSGGTTYYYTGSGKAVTTDPSKAVKLSVSGTKSSVINFGAPPTM